MAAPTLTDGTVTLRPHRPDDVPRIVEQSTDPTSVAWTTVPVPYAAADAEDYSLRVLAEGFEAGTEWAFAVEVGGLYAGTVSLRPEEPGLAEIAYGSHPDVRGTGTMERALRLLLAWGYDEQGLRCVVWRAFTGNWASRRLAWRLGFTVEGTLRSRLPQRGELRDAWIGTLLADDPRQPSIPWLANPVLEGDGVRLRPFTGADVPRIVEGLGDSETQHWLSFMPRDPGLAQGEAYVEQVTQRLADGHTVTWAVADRADDRLLGAMGIYRVREEPELGYWTHPDARGNGTTTRAARLAVEHAFTALALTRLAAYTSVPNAASRRVLTRLGFQPTGVRRAAATTGAGEVVDLAGYDLLASEWNPSTSTTNPASESPTPTTSGEA